MKKLEEYNEAHAALFLIEEHSAGYFRDEKDLDNAKRHAELTISFIEDLLINIEGTVEDKIKFISKIKEEIPKFSAK